MQQPRVAFQHTILRIGNRALCVPPFTIHGLHTIAFSSSPLGTAFLALLSSRYPFNPKPALIGRVLISTPTVDGWAVKRVWAWLAESQRRRKRASKLKSKWRPAGITECSGSALIHNTHSCSTNRYAPTSIDKPSSLSHSADGQCLPPGISSFTSLDISISELPDLLHREFLFDTTIMPTDAIRLAASLSPPCYDANLIFSFIALILIYLAEVYFINPKLLVKGAKALFSADTAPRTPSSTRKGVRASAVRARMWLSHPDFMAVMATLPHKPLCKLSVSETRTLSILCGILAAPPVLFVDSLDIPCTILEPVTRLLHSFSRMCAPCLVGSSESACVENCLFDGSVIAGAGHKSLEIVASPYSLQERKRIGEIRAHGFLNSSFLNYQEIRFKKLKKDRNGHFNNRVPTPVPENNSFQSLLSLPAYSHTTHPHLESPRTLSSDKLQPEEPILKPPKIISYHEFSAARHRSASQKTPSPHFTHHIFAGLSARIFPTPRTSFAFISRKLSLLSRREAPSLAPLLFLSALSRMLPMHPLVHLLVFLGAVRASLASGRKRLWMLLLAAACLGGGHLGYGLGEGGDCEALVVLSMVTEEGCLLAEDRGFLEWYGEAIGGDYVVGSAVGLLLRRGAAVWLLGHLLGEEWGWAVVDGAVLAAVVGMGGSRRLREVGTAALVGSGWVWGSQRRCGRRKAAECAAERAEGGRTGGAWLRAYAMGAFNLIFAQSGDKLAKRMHAGSWKSDGHSLGVCTTVSKGGARGMPSCLSESSDSLNFECPDKIHHAIVLRIFLYILAYLFCRVRIYLFAVEKDLDEN